MFEGKSSKVCLVVHVDLITMNVAVTAAVVVVADVVDAAAAADWPTL